MAAHNVRRWAKCLSFAPLDSITRQPKQEILIEFLEDGEIVL